MLPLHAGQAGGLSTYAHMNNMPGLVLCFSQGCHTTATFQSLDNDLPGRAGDAHVNGPSVKLMTNAHSAYCMSDVLAAILLEVVSNLITTYSYSSLLQECMHSVLACNMIEPH